MPKYRITAPDGGTYEITAPEGASDADIMSYAQQSFSGGAQQQTQRVELPQQPNEVPYGEGLARAGFQGLTFGAGDEITAGGVAALNALKGDNIGATYDKVLSRERGRMDRFRDQAPIASAVAEVGGALPTALIPLGALGRAAQGGSLTTKALAGGAIGAGQGGLYGFNSSEGGFDNRLDGAATGAAIGGTVGGTIGAAAPTVVRGVGSGARAAWQKTAGRLGRDGQINIAHAKLYEALLRDGLTPDEAMVRLSQMGPNAVLADVGENTRRLAGAVSRIPGKGAPLLDDFVRARQEGVRGTDMALNGGQIQRITGLIDDLVPENFNATREGIRANSTKGDLYTEAFRANQQIESVEINRLLETPAGKTALRKAAEKMQNALSNVSRTDPELTAAYREAIALGQIDDVLSGTGVRGIGRGLKLRTLDYVKRALGDMEQAARRTGAADDANIYGDLRRSLTRALDGADVTAQAGPRSLRPEGGLYAQARSAAADVFSRETAMDAGRQFMTRSGGANAEDLARSVAEMGAHERHLFRVGAVRAIKDRVGTLVSRADATKKLKDIPDLERRVRLAFGDDNMFAAYMRGLDNESQMFRTYAEITGGSPTAQRLAAQLDSGVDPSAIAQDAIGVAANPTSLANLLNTGLRVAGRAKDRVVLPEVTRTRLAELLSQRDAGLLNNTAAVPNLSASRLAQLLAQRNTAIAGPLSQ